MPLRRPTCHRPTPSRTGWRTPAIVLVVLVSLSTMACRGQGDGAASDPEAGATDPDAPERVTDPDTDPQLVFWASLQALCGQAFQGRVTESVPPDPAFEGQRIVIHVRSCDPAEIRIPFQVGEDRSRTWVVTPTATGLRLKHEHRHQDGSDDAITDYGGDAWGRGTATLQEFRADAHTAELVPEAADNVWSLEIRPGEALVYALRREGSDRRFRVEFDLTRPVEEPPPPWGG